MGGGGVLLVKTVRTHDWARIKTNASRKIEGFQRRKNGRKTENNLFTFLSVEKVITVDTVPSLHFIIITEETSI